MRIPLTKYGMPQVLVVPLIILAAMAIIALVSMQIWPLPVVLLIELLPSALLIFSLSFFRDPHRQCPSDSNLLLSPADGKVTEIETIEGNGDSGRAGLKIGIFLSVFNTHINRAPCNVRVEKITYKKGMYKNALNPESGKVNESNELQFVRTDSPNDKIAVKQISGAIARRIVCKTDVEDELAAGEKFGMIKFGSRTELYIPFSSDTSNEMKCLVKIGDKVKAGLTALVRYEKCQE